MIYEYRRALDDEVRARITFLTDKLVGCNDYQQADVLRGRIKECHEMLTLHQRVVERFVQEDDDSDPNLPEQ